MAQDYDAYGTAGSGAEPKKNRTLVIILIVIAVLLLCCCLILAGGWFFGDQILEILRDQGFDVGLTLLSMA